MRSNAPAGALPGSAPRVLVLVPAADRARGPTSNVPRAAAPPPTAQPTCQSRRPRAGVWPVARVFLRCSACLRRPDPSGRLSLGDRSLRASSSKEGDRPTGQGREPVLEPGEEREVDDQPREPAGQAGDADRPDGQDGPEASDRGQGPQVAIAEWTLPLVAARPAHDRLRRVMA